MTPWSRLRGPGPHKMRPDLRVSAPDWDGARAPARKGLELRGPGRPQGSCGIRWRPPAPLNSDAFELPTALPAERPTCQGLDSGGMFTITGRLKGLNKPQGQKTFSRPQAFRGRSSRLRHPAVGRGRPPVIGLPRSGSRARRPGGDRAPGEGHPAAPPPGGVGPGPQPSPGLPFGKPRCARPRGSGPEPPSRWVGAWPPRNATGPMLLRPISASRYGRAFARPASRAGL